MCEGEEQKKLEQYARRIKSPVHFLGKVDTKGKVELLQRAWVLVNPSSMEGWGLTVIEANACGTPVVASDVPGLRDSVNQDLSGFLVPYGNVAQFAEKTSLLITNAAVRRKISRQATVWSKHFSWVRSAHDSLALIQGHHVKSLRVSRRRYAKSNI